MRISDWSSDGCSSDLEPLHAPLPSLASEGQSHVITLVPPASAPRSPSRSPPPPVSPRPDACRRRRNSGWGCCRRDCAPGTKLGRAHVCTPVTNALLVCRLLLAKTNSIFSFFLFFFSLFLLFFLFYFSLLLLFSFSYFLIFL